MGQGIMTRSAAGARRPCFYFLLALALAMPLVFLTTVPPGDVASRYAPMAAAFASGKWSYAFHPRVPMLFSALGGILAFPFHGDGFLGVKLASALVFALAVFPLFQLFKLVFSPRVAVWGVVFYLFCHLLLQYAGEGLRDNGKTLSLALAAWALLSLWDAPRQLSSYLWLGGAIGLGFLFRTELLVVGGFLLLAAAIRECLEKQPPWRSFSGGVVILLLMTPAIVVNAHFTGYPIPDVRLIAWIQQHRPRPASPESDGKVVKKGVSTEHALSVSSARERRPRSSGSAPFVETGTPLKAGSRLSVLEYLGAFFRGFYPPFLLPVLFGVAWRIARRSWIAKESVLLCIVFGNAVVTALLCLIAEGHLYISRRYLLPAAPLLFGWCGYFAVSLWDFCRARWPKWFPPLTAAVIFIVCGGILYGAALSPMVRNFTSKKRRARNGAIFACAETLRRNYRGEPYGVRTFQLLEYRSCQRPFVVVPDPLGVSPSIAGGSRVYDLRLADYLVRSVDEAPPSPRQWGKVSEVRGYRNEHYVIWGRLHIPPGGETK